MADLGVDEEFRNQDIGKKLVKERLAYLRRWDSAALMRTSVDNDKSQKLYKSLNFTQLAGLIQEVEQQRVDGSVKKDKRIFFIRTVY
jgi:ribosomal protein S18 acetylase RimI-like enzyme